jgi:hypothetical protein
MKTMFGRLTAAPAVAVDVVDDFDPPLHAPATIAPAMTTLMTTDRLRFTAGTIEMECERFVRRSPSRPQQI